MVICIVEYFVKVINFYYILDILWRGYRVSFIFFISIYYFYKYIKKLFKIFCKIGRVNVLSYLFYIL